jgi:hypothetical protein
MEAIQIRESSGLTVSQSLAVEASHGQRITACSREELAQMFRRLMVLIGAAGVNIPTDIEASFLLESAPQVIGKYTTDEVLTAFTLAIKGDIQAELTLYDKPFNLKYVGDVMKAYDEFKKEAMYQHRKHQPELPAHVPSRAELDAQMRVEALECYRLHCEGRGNWSNYHPPLYDYLTRLNVVLFAPERIERAKVEAMRIIRSEAAITPQYTQTMQELLKKLTPEDSRVERKAKEMLLREFFEELHAGGNQLADYI